MTLAVPIEPATGVFLPNPNDEPGKIRYGAHPTYLGPSWGSIGSQTLNPASGNLTFDYQGALPLVGPGIASSVTITFPLYSAQTRFEQTANVDTAWFFANEWFRDLYYAVVPQRLPGGGGGCAPNCLTVLNPVSAPPNDKEVVLTLAGRSNNGVPRSTAVLADYFELENDEVAGPTVGTFVRQPRSLTFNDKVVVVAPCTPPGPTPCP
jgi:hypothetical protein